ncbi:AraC family transcriptional regulator [Acanthopleuribacter pedis]|uniref:AraC family transcriptional regulator n=1 Tax=Acanthopleuribacter pedis TaxID=442870 RepID=A0A8J7QJK6_9BACT|nr:AraC family transcriptional regulator [Acanthopleuribacter pedis]MBO1319390.1 AraC family transcriptional regulator [Acanthopleuribacter pedis]
MTKPNPHHRTSSDWIFQAPGAVQRFEAFFADNAYAPHRHDTYAIGWTLAGVQTFDYRGAVRRSLPGHAVIVHPDELHNGFAGTDEGFRYRVLYVEPADIQAALGGKALPFVPDGVSNDPRLRCAVTRLLGSYEDQLAPLEYQDAIFDLAQAMDAVAGQGSTRRKRFDYQAAETARQYLCRHWDESVTMEELETVCDRDRWQLSRDFRALFGTSPYRYLVMRRLARARERLAEGAALVDVAVDCAFSDQSHMTRHFRKTYGITPRRWLAALQR